MSYINKQTVKVSFHSLLNPTSSNLTSETKEVSTIKKSSHYPSYTNFKPKAIPPEMSKDVFLNSLWSNISGFESLDAVGVKELERRKVIVDIGASNDILLNPFLSENKILQADGGVIHSFRLVEDNRTYTVMNEINKHYKGNGTPLALGVRLREQVPTIAPPIIDDNKFRLISDFIWKVYPVDVKSFKTFKETNLMNCNIEINKDAHPGAPFYKSGVNLETVYEQDNKPLRVITVVANLAEKYFKLCQQGYTKSIIQYFESIENRYEFLSLVCPKVEVMKRDNYLTKVRPFFVMPAALKLLFTPIADNTIDTMKNFLEDPNSHSAFRFTWNRGGAQKMWNWIKGKQKTPGFHWLAWGDDCIIVAVAKDRTSIIIMPDVSGMDAKITTLDFELATKYILRSSQFEDRSVSRNVYRDINVMKEFLKNSKFNITWINVLRFYEYYSTHTPILGPKGKCFDSSKGLKSGTVLTSFIDFIGTARNMYELQTIPIPDTFNSIDIKMYVDSLFLKSKQTGFPFKDDTRTVQCIMSDKKTYISEYPYDKMGDLPQHMVLGIKFLGAKIKNYSFDTAYTKDSQRVEILVPYYEWKEGVVNAAFSVYTDREPQIRNGKLLSALFGMGYTQFSSPGYVYLDAAFNSKISQSYRPVVDHIESDALIDVDVTDLEKIQEYPTRDFFAQLFLSEEDRPKVNIITFAHSLLEGVGLPPKPKEKKEIIDEIDIGEDGELKDIRDEIKSDEVDLAEDIESDRSETPPPPPPPIINSTSTSNSTSEDKFSKFLKETNGDTTFPVQGKVLSIPNMLTPKEAAQHIKGNLLIDKTLGHIQEQISLGEPKHVIPKKTVPTGKVPFNAKHRLAKKLAYEQRAHQKYITRLHQWKESMDVTRKKFSEKFVSYLEEEDAEHIWDAPDEEDYDWAITKAREREIDDMEEDFVIDQRINEKSEKLEDAEEAAFNAFISDRMDNIGPEDFEEYMEWNKHNNGGAKHHEDLRKAMLGVSSFYNKELAYQLNNE